MNLAIALEPNEHLVYIAFGGNLGDVSTTIHSALQALQEQIGPIVRKSPIYKTTPLTAPDIDAATVPAFQNGAALFKTRLSPQQTMQTCLQIEKSLGRVRDTSNQLASRAIDLDIALYDDLILEEAHLQIPHPRLHERDFVLVPLLDLNPDLIHPRLGVSLRSLLETLPTRYVL